MLAIAPKPFSHSPHAVVMVRPSHFTPNPQTADDNAFQVDVSASRENNLSAHAYREVTNMVAALRDAGVTVHLFEDPTDLRPDAVFPNNWFSTHADGSIVTYPMYSDNRRLERRIDIIDTLKATYQVDVVVDYTNFETRNAFLEGTGAMVFDHTGKVVYASRSRRMNDHVLRRFCKDYGYSPIVFEAHDSNGAMIYHTNVMMSVGSDFAIVGLDTINDERARQTVVKRLEASGREIIDLTFHQIDNFAANCLELESVNGRVLAISQRGLDALDAQQIMQIEKHVRILPFNVETIEMAGGSVRCMLAGIHLPLNQQNIVPFQLDTANV